MLIRKGWKFQRLDGRINMVEKQVIFYDYFLIFRVKLMVLIRMKVRKYS
jgi:hypothetical protein